MSISITDSGRIKVIAKFYHQGPAYSSAALHVALGNYKVLGVTVPYFDEKIADNFDVLAIVAHSTATQITCTVYLDVTVPAEYSGDNSLYLFVKLYNIPGSNIEWFSSSADITLLKTSQTAVFTNLSVTYSKV
jgi:hypothetical protein